MGILIDASVVIEAEGGRIDSNQMTARYRRTTKRTLRVPRLIGSVSACLRGNPVEGLWTR
jgi:hypothetical protein